MEVELKGKEGLQTPLAYVLDEVKSKLSDGRSSERDVGRQWWPGIFEPPCVRLLNINFVLTGSEVGVLRDFLRLDDANSPLFGRYSNVIGVERFSRERSIDFLVKGFERLNLKQDLRKIEEAVDGLDGLVGYLVTYGCTV